MNNAQGNYPCSLIVTLGWHWCSPWLGGSPNVYHVRKHFHKKIEDHSIPDNKHTIMGTNFILEDTLKHNDHEMFLRLLSLQRGIIPDMYQ